MLAIASLIISRILSTVGLIFFSLRNNLLTLFLSSMSSFVHMTLSMVPTKLSSFTKMVLIQLELGLIPNFSHLLTNPSEVIQQERVVPPIMLPLAFPSPSLWL